MLNWAVITFAEPSAAPQTSADPSFGPSAPPGRNWNLLTPAGTGCPERRCWSWRLSPPPGWVHSPC